MNLEARIQEALEWSGCELKEHTQPKSLTVRKVTREFILAILIFDWTEIEWYIDVSEDAWEFWNRLLVNRWWALINQMPCKISGLLYAPYKYTWSKTYKDWEEVRDSKKEFSGIYFPDIPYDICFPHWYRFHAASSEYFEAENEETWILLRYYISDLKAKEQELKTRRNWETNIIEKVIVSPEIKLK